jgi:tryptophan synthase alpha chain
MSRLTSTFRRLRDRDETALVAYLTGGDPTPAASLPLLREAARHADVLEIGMPFSDPIADGPTIQAATGRALISGTTPPRVLSLIREVRRGSATPIVVLTYTNLAFHHPGGPRGFCRALAAAGGDGLILADLPVEECGPFREAARAARLDLVLLAAPTSDGTRVARIASRSSGFLYLVSLLGVTGVRSRLPPGLAATVGTVRRAAGGLPVAVGFGISRPEHVGAVRAMGAEGAIVGSALVKLVERRRGVRGVGRFLAGLKEATRG